MAIPATSAVEQAKTKPAPASSVAPKPWEAPPERDMKEFMGHVISYSAFNVWNWQGWITDKNGTRSLFPKNDEEWAAAESAAQTLDEVTSLLQLPNRRLPAPGWDENTLLVRKVARQLADAAMKQDADAFFKLGGDLQEACEKCHVAMGLVAPASVERSGAAPESSPEIRASRLAQQGALIRHRFPDLATALGLQREEADRLIDLLAEHAVKSEENPPLVPEGAFDWDPSTESEWVRKVEEDQRHLDEKVYALLGEAKFRAWQEYGATSSARDRELEIQRNL